MRPSTQYLIARQVKHRPRRKSGTAMTIPMRSIHGSIDPATGLPLDSSQTRRKAKLRTNRLRGNAGALPNALARAAQHRPGPTIRF